MPDTILRPKVSEIVAERLKRDIHSGAFAVGARLPSERDLMKRFGVGRSAVREALFALQKSGNIRIRNGERALVTAPSPLAAIAEMTDIVRPLVADEAGMRHFQEVRIVVEGALARRAASVATDADIARIKVHLDENRFAGEDADKLQRSDVAFHLAIAQVGGNPFFPMLYEAANLSLVDQRRTSVVVPEAARVATRWHERIFERIAARDPDGAMAAMEGHLRMVRDFYWQVRDLENAHRAQHEREVYNLSSAPSR